MIEPALFKALLEDLADRDLVQKARDRLACKHEAVEVDIEEL